jgi:hypothetical protein
MVGDTKPLDEKCCSRCGEKKEVDKFIKNRNICKICSNKRKKENRDKAIENIVTEANQKCNACNETKNITLFVKKRKVCCDCDNKRRRLRYQTDENHRLNAIQQASEFKHKKVIERRQLKLQEIGENNKKCSVCFTIKPKDRFRHNRLRCKDCERDEPIQKFIRNVRSRIYIALNQTKENHTNEYLGISNIEYIKWICHYNDKYTLENRGKEWHIDHVIPLSKFNLENKSEQLIAFNWRNTMPLSPKENLSKNCKIIKTQIEQHYKKLVDYHKEKNIEMPQEFIDLFAKHLVDGNPLKPSLPLTTGNVCEDLG